VDASTKRLKALVASTTSWWFDLGKVGFKAKSAVTFGVMLYLPETEIKIERLVYKFRIHQVL
jgi:hypothetical protein